MIDIAATDDRIAIHTSPAATERLRRRYAAERRFKICSIAAVAVALGMLAFLLISITAKGYTAFVQTEATLLIHFDEQEIDPNGTRDQAVLASANYQRLISRALYELFPDVTDRRGRSALRKMVSAGAQYELRDRVVANPHLIGTTAAVAVLLHSDIDQLNKGHVDRTVPETRRKVSDRQVEWFDQLEHAGMISAPFNTRLFTNADSRDPELAGLRGAIKGSFFTLVICLALSFPIGVAAAIYLEEFAPKNRWTDLIEVNINNMAAIPSIIFGLLGLAVFIQIFGLPRSAPLVGGMVLSLMTLPTIIIAARAAMKSVPPSIREAAFGMGASPLQVVAHHVLPLAMPGILTGTIIGMARALGESAPLLMIGMNAFIVSAPESITSPSTALPMQVYIWADSPERGFVSRASAATMVLLAFLIAMNGTAVWLRKKFERRW